MSLLAENSFTVTYTGCLDLAERELRRANPEPYPLRGEAVKFDRQEVLSRS